MTEWKETRFAERPDSIIKIGPGLFMQTKNVRYRSEGEGYVCETREVTESELLLLNKISELEQTIASTNAQLLNNL